VTTHRTVRYQVKAPEAGKVKAAIAAFAERPSFAALKESTRCPDSGPGSVIAVGSE
jgi:hypothetical protein